ncbi:MAG TPA: hypothetical protein GXX55_04335 [Firmicutes bacterium]|nr:hypothetical protein [Bacillota bacterium]
MVEHTVCPLHPSKISNVGGFLGKRFHANLQNRLKNWRLVEDFILMHERKDHDDWFWMGEQIGKWLDSAAFSCQVAGDKALRARVEEVLQRLAATQEEDGYLGITSRMHRNPVRGMQLYEWYYVLHGLLACYDVLGSDVALQIATRLGNYIIRTWGVEPGQFPLMGRFPGNGHDGGEGTLILEPIVLLGMRTGDRRFIEWGEKTVGMWDTWSAQYPESIHTGPLALMQAVAEGRRHVHEVRENIHAHTLHMNLLGLAALYEATGKADYKGIVLGCIKDIADNYVFLTGGMSSGERYIPFRYYHPKNDIEVCPQHTWILLLDQALRWTGEARYAEELERTLLNSFLAAQLADGSNWSYMTPLNGQAQRPSTPNCCNAAGQRLVGRIPVFLYGQTEDGIVVHQYSASDAEFVFGDGTTVTVKQRTEYPSRGSVVLNLDPERPVAFKLYVRIPSFATGAKMSVNGREPVAITPGTYAVCEREWRPGDTVALELPLQVTARANDRYIALVRGPLVYAYFQAWQQQPERFYWNQGVYPEDIELILNPDQLEGVRETDAPEGCLGPALRVRARRRLRAPVFARCEANNRLPGEEEIEAILLPFVNQGTRNGHYAVFMSYIRAL